MNDIKLQYDSLLQIFDMAFSDGDIVREAGLETAVIISTFTDRRAGEEDKLDDINDKRGWWGDQTSNISLDRIGSRLWLLDRSKTDRETLRRAEEYEYEALEWMIEDGVAESIEVTATRNKLIDDVSKNITEVLGLEVVIKKIDGNIETFRFANVWDAQLTGG